MAYLIGTDEAGYGPNLGPLVVTASVWNVRTLQQTDLFAHLRTAIRRPDEEADQRHVRVGDSKALYKPGQGLAGLEQGVWTILRTLNMRPSTWKQIWVLLAQQDAPSIKKLPWYQEFDARLPVDIAASELEERAARMHDACTAVACSPTRIACRVIVPNKFNELCMEFGNKAAALSQTTLQLVRDVLQDIPDDEPVYVLCDKHGGRNKYGPLLNQVFPETLALVRQESRAQSVYQWGSGNGRREFEFRAKADTVFLPSALASMVSKYLRELAMRAFNQYWTTQVDGLKPTAGYPVDAKRFKHEITAAQQALGIADRDLWRFR